MLYPAKRLVACGLLSALIVSAHAANFPRGCETTGFGYNGRYLIINPNGQQTFFLLENRAGKTVQLQRHETRDVFMSPKLETNLASAAWAAFASDEQNLVFQCAIKNESGFSDINCNEALNVCQYPRARFALSNMGNYWVSTNKSQGLVIKEAVAKGIYLKW
jgi:hypothetical protein